VFKRLFGKPDDEPSGLSMNRWVAPNVETADIQLPSRKPPPDVKDLVLPETLAQEARHPKEVDLSFGLASRGSGDPAAPDGPVHITDAQIEVIAQRVADKLASGVVGDRLREAVARIVSETSERLVREEIARIRAEADRE
jgi:hypothetical protein